MALYKGHVKFNLLIALPILVGGIFFFLSPHRNDLIIFSSIFVYGTLFMNPDLDLANQISLFSLRGLLTLPFRSYARIFSHRGLSHHPLFGSLTRIGWLFIWGALIFLIIYQTLPSHATLLKFYKHYQSYILYAFAAICCADWCHLLLDLKKH